MTKGKNMRVRHNIAVFLSGLFFLLSVSAFAEEKPLWEIGIGAALLHMPDYRGSNENRLYLLPYPYAVYRGDIFRVDENRITGQIFKTDRVLLDFSVFGSVPVKSSRNTARAGMEDLDPTFELGPSLRINIWESREDKFKVNATLPVRAFFSTDFSSIRREGWVFSPRVNVMKRDVIPDTGMNLGISFGPMFADSGYHEYFYEVAPGYATPVRPAYNAGGGYSGTTLTFGLSKAYKQFIFNAFISADFLQGACFEDSPLVKRETSLMSGFNVSWIFMKSETRVDTE